MAHSPFWRNLCASCAHVFAYSRTFFACSHLFLRIRARLCVFWRATLRRGRLPSDSGRDRSASLHATIWLWPQAVFDVCSPNTLRCRRHGVYQRAFRFGRQAPHSP